MDKRPNISPAVVEAFVLLNFVFLFAALLSLPFLQPSAVEIAFLGFSLVVNVVVAFLYALFTLRYQPPVGKHFLPRNKGKTRDLKHFLYSILN